MKKRGHYCKVCGEYKANEKFSGKGHAAHICKTCAALPPEKQAEEMALTRLVNLPWRLSKEQLSWLKKRMKDKRDAVRALATEQYEMRFPPRIELDELEDGFEEDFDFYMDEETDIEKPMRSVISRPLIFWKGGGPHMATTRIIPLHAGKGRTVGKAISDIIDYVKNPEKTDHGRLITSYQCDSRVADAQFLLDKQTYAARTGRVRGKDDVIAYHLRQSFVPGEITPEEANRLGVELARRFTKGKHAFIVCTHIDKAHVHNHIIWNSTTLECDRKFRNFWGSTHAVHRLSDTICIENGYSIVEAPKRCGQSYNKWLGDAAKPSHKEQLRQAIDRALAQKPASLEELLRLLEQDGFTVHRRGKTISISAEGWGNNVRFDRLGDGYTLNDLLAALPARKSIRPAIKPSRRSPRPRSICWWTSRQNSRPGKVPGMPTGPRCSTSNRWRRPSTTCPNTGCWIMPIWKPKQQRRRPVTTRCPTGSRPPRSAWPRLPYCAPTSSTTPRPATPMWPIARLDIQRNSGRSMRKKSCCIRPPRKPSTS